MTTTPLFGAVMDPEGLPLDRAPCVAHRAGGRPRRPSTHTLPPTRDVVVERNEGVAHVLWRLAELQLAEARV